MWCTSTFAQQAVIKVLVKGSETPVEGAIIILKATDQSKKQEICFTDEQGEAIDKFQQEANLLIHCFGFKDFTDTILANQSYTFYLEKSEIDLEEVVVTGQYDINTTDKSLYNIKTVDAKTIEAMGAQHLDDVLRNQLSTRISQDNLLGSSASINGISGQNVKILVDGIPVIGRENGNIDISQINMNNVERIEIVEGPMSVSYGTDAIGGLINIVTKKSSSYPLAGNLNLYYESNGTYNGDASLYLQKDKNAFSLSGGRYFFDGYSDVDTSRYQEWKPKLQYFGTFNYNFINKFLNVGFKSEYFNEEIQNKGTPVITPYSAYAFDDYYFTRRLNESLVIEYRLKNNAHLQFINAFNNYRRVKNTYRKDLVSLEQDLTTGEGTQDTTVFNEVTLRGTYSSVLPSRKINFQTGYDVNLQMGTGANLLSTNETINDYAAFGSLEYEAFTGFYLRPGFRFAYNTRYGAPLTPSLNLKFDFLEKYSVRASYARGFRSPSLKELNLEFVDANHNIHGNNSLQAETSNNFNVDFSVLNKIGVYNIKANISFFYNDISNIITLALINSSSNYYTYINIDKYKTRGATFTADFKMKNFSFTTGFSLLGLYNSLSDSFGVEKFSLTPEFQNNFTLDFPKANLSAAVFFKSTGSTPSFNVDENGEVYQTFLEPYTIMDASLTKSFFKKHISLIAGVKNIFDVSNLQTNAVGGFHSASSSEVPYGTGRFLFLGLKLKFFKD